MKNPSNKFYQLNMDILISGLLILASIAVGAIFAVIAASRPLTNLEAVLLQSFGLGAGLVGSYIFGRQSTQKAAIELVKPHARSAFRRLWSLYQSLSRLAEVVQSEQKTRLAQGENGKEKNNECIAVVEAIILEQLSTADDALEDWRDLIPEDIEDLEKRMNVRQLKNNRAKVDE
jgi:hypothetical protein